jgi:hypothetical protein
MPNTPEPDPVLDLTLSRDARDSTYEPAKETREVQPNPPDGPRVEQHLGKPSESVAKADESASAEPKTTTTKSSSSS